MTLTTTLRNYRGQVAFLALHVTDARGAYAGSLWLAASKARYFEHLRDWYGATGGNRAEVSGITGASVGAGRTLTVTLDLADALFDAGYQIHIDTAVENMCQSPSENVVPLTRAGAGTPVAGVSGLALAARRMGGWRMHVRPVRGGASSECGHLLVARIAAAPGLLLLVQSGLWMAGATFGVGPEGSARPDLAPVSGVAGMAIAAMPALAVVPARDLGQRQFPRADDANGIYTLETTSGTGGIDQGTGALLGWADRSRADRVRDTVHLLHTGEGAALLGLMLGLSVLAVPMLSGTGPAVWLAGRSRKPKLKNAAAEDAETIVLVGSEGGSTWGCARAPQAAIAAAGGSVHLAPMSDFAPTRQRARAQPRRQRARAAAPEPRLPCRRGPRSADPDRRRCGRRATGGFCPRQPQQTPDPSLFWCARARGRPALWPGADRVARRRAAGIADHGAVAQPAVPRMGCWLSAMSRWQPRAITAIG